LALLAGWSDPLTYLDASDERRLIADAMVNQALELRAEELKNLAEMIGHFVAQRLSG